VTRQIEIVGPQTFHGRDQRLGLQQHGSEYGLFRFDVLRRNAVEHPFHLHLHLRSPLEVVHLDVCSSRCQHTAGMPYSSVVCTFSVAFTSGCSLIGTCVTPSARIGSSSSIFRLSTV